MFCLTMGVLFLCLLFVTAFSASVTAALIPRDNERKSSTSLSSTLSMNTTASTMTSVLMSESDSIAHSGSGSGSSVGVSAMDAVKTITLEVVRNTASNSPAVLPSALPSKSDTTISSSITVVKTLVQNTDTSTTSRLQEGTSPSQSSSTASSKGPSSITSSPSASSSSFDNQVSTTTMVRHYTFTGLSTVVEFTTTFTDYLSTHQAPNPLRCQYFGICPSAEPLPSELLSVSEADASARKSQCEKSINLSEATAEFRTTIEESTITRLITHSTGEIETLRQTTSIARTISQPDYQRVGCGGMCNIIYYNVEVLFFPPTEWANKSNCVSDPNFTYTFPEMSVRDVQAQAQPTGSTVVNEDGFTFTSPSVYVRFGTVSATNEYGQVGNAHTSFTVAFAPGELHTEFNPLGFGAPEFTSYPFDIHNVTCNSRPVIAFPTKLRQVDPAWSLCSGGGPYQGNDPPLALTPAAALPDPNAVDAKTTDPVPIASPPPAPASTTPDVFQPTQFPGGWISNDPNDETSDPESNETPKQNDPPSDEPSEPPNSPLPESQESPSEPDLGPIIASAIGLPPPPPNSGPGGNGDSPPGTKPSVSLLNPSQLLIGSTTLTPGSGPTVVEDHTVDFRPAPASAPPGAAPIVVVDSSTLNLHAPAVTPDPAVAGGDSKQDGDSGGAGPQGDSVALPPGVSVLDASRAVVDGVTVTRGAALTTLAGGEVLSWDDEDGAGLVVGGTTVDVNAAAAAVSATALESGTMSLPPTITLDSGQTLTMGGAAITADDGRLASYGVGGLVVDGHTVSLPTSTGTGAGEGTVEITSTGLVAQVSETGAAGDGIAVGEAGRTIGCKGVGRWVLLICAVLMGV